MTHTIGILQTGDVPDELQDHGSYPDMVADWLTPLGGTVRVWNLPGGELPGDVTDADLWAITGSRHGVYEDHAWIPPLEDFIRACRDSATPMVGICFGHQIMAQALGGRARKSHKGWGLGVHDHPLTPDWPAALPPPPGDLRLRVLHQDQVEELPEGATRLAGSEFCDIAAAWYPGFGISFQGHPEFDAGFVSDLLNLRRGAPYPVGRTDVALEDVETPTTRRAWAKWLKDAVPRL